MARSVSFLPGMLCAPLPGFRRNSPKVLETEEDFPDNDQFMFHLSLSDTLSLLHTQA